MKTQEDTMADVVTYNVGIRVEEVGRDAYGFDSTVTLCVESGMAEVLKAAIDATVEQVIDKMKKDAAIG